ncbi:hypothetical protein ACFU53_18865 [Streptomyces sp. NPDC057474]|uniref:hypothetical protein n=1 Tax=Streptomyces sp. NPDC057474 TaxID=3346144 RepID=UPI0036CB7974
MAGEESTKTAELLERAWRLAGKHRYREARALVEKTEPESPAELVLAARVLLELRDPYVALPLARRALALEEGLWRAYVVIAFAHLRGRATHQEGVVAARMAVRLAPDEPEPYAALGYALVKRDGPKSAESRAAYERAKELAGGTGRKRLRPPGAPRPVVGWVWPAVVMAFGVLTLIVPEDLRLLFQAILWLVFLVSLAGVVRPWPAGMSWREARRRRRSRENDFGR